MSSPENPSDSAGASEPYGYPLGVGLVRRIVGLTAPDAVMTRHLFGTQDVSRFHACLADADASSIDDFLESNPASQVLGKICIAACLTVYGPGVKQVPDPAYDWYPYLWHRLHEGATKSTQFRLNQLRVITYNYDQSLERYLDRVLRNTYPDLGEMSSEDLASFRAASVPVWHLHGTLHGADGVVRGLEDRSLYDTLGFYQQAANDIQIVSEVQSSGVYEEPQAVLSGSKVVHILGFGFHPTNVTRLKLADCAHRVAPGWSHVGATAFGLEKAERDRVEIQLGLGNGVLQVADCLSYLRKYAVLE